MLGGDCPPLSFRRRLAHSSDRPSGAPVTVLLAHQYPLTELQTEVESELFTKFMNDKFTLGTFLVSKSLSKYLQSARQHSKCFSYIG